jgi:hypothetical protein
MDRQMIDDFACNHCRLSLKKLREMAEVGGVKEIFTTPARGCKMNIYNITKDGFIMMRRSTGKITWGLNIYTLRCVHDLVHAGNINLDANAIASTRIDGTKKAALWGTYIAALLKHLGCDRIK